MPRGRKVKPNVSIDAPVGKLIEAVRFVALTATPEYPNCMLTNKYIVAFNGVLSCGQPIEDNINTCPKMSELIAALEMCGSQFTIDQLDANRLIIKAEKFTAALDCILPTAFNLPALDNNVAAIDDRLKEGFAAIGGLLNDKAETVLASSFIIRKNSMVATDRSCLIEFWHGIDLPTMIIPKASAMAIVKTPKKLTGFGYTPNKSATFYFDDGAWMRTQLYDVELPDIDKVLNIVGSKQEAIPANFWQAVKAVAQFAPEGDIHLSEGTVSSMPTGDEVAAGSSIEDGTKYENAKNGAIYECPINADCIVSYKYLKLIEPLAKTIDFNATERSIYFYGERTRGATATKA